MITTPTKPDHRQLPRKKRPPSPRDQAIYLAYRTTGVSQAKLAADNRLSQRRISAIIHRVERWRADLNPAATGQLDPQQSQRLERWLEQQRLQAVYDRSIRGFDTQKPELKTTRKGNRDGKPYHDETTCEVPPNVQLLKVALRAATDLGKLNDKPAPAAPQPQDAEQRFWQAHALIRELRQDAGMSDDQSLWSKESTHLTQALHDLIHRGIGDSPPTPTRSVSEGRAAPADVGWVKAAAAADPRGSDAPSSAECRASADFEPETCNLKPETQNSSNCSNPAPGAEAPAEPTIAAATPTDEPTSRAPQPTSNPCSPSAKKQTPPVLEPEPSLAERRRRHDEKLNQLHEARRRGLPCLIEFDPEDGPLPSTFFHLSDFGHQPTPPPSSAEIRDQNERYLAQLRAQHEVNNRQWSEPTAPS
jgi:hypothetical protein